MSKVKLNCDHCGTVFFRSASQRRGNASYCGSKCRYAAMQKHGQGHPLYKSVIVSCANCGADVKRKPCEIAARSLHFCNRTCRAMWSKKHPPGENHPRFMPRIETQCSYCHSPLQRLPYRTRRIENAFCNATCYARWRSENLRGEVHPHYERVLTECTVCGNEVAIKPSQHKRNRGLFCSRACYGEWRSQNLNGPNHPLWNGGSVEYRGPNWKRQSRAARERDSNRCRICGSTESLSVHHIVPFRAFGFVAGENDLYKQANCLSNLITLCRSCHGRVEHGTLALPEN
jgi:5-methylcytosine-specific restriction endonuclease McrA